MRVTVLSSGSGGNCTLVEGAGVRVLVDAGLPLRVVKARMAAAGVPLDQGPITDLLLTHEHSDHGGCAGVLGRKLGVTVRATEGTLRALRDPPPEEQWAFASPGVPVRLGVAACRLPEAPGSPAPAEGPPPSAAGPGSLFEALFRGSGNSAHSNVVPLRPPVRGPELWATPITLPHDAAAPVAFRFEERTAQGSVHAAIVTDLGHAPESVASALLGLDLLVIEFNHDVKMLLEGPYPWPLKQRIRGGLGHLSNEQAAALLQKLCHPGLKQVVLAHLSEHNNTPKLARAAAEGALARARSGALLQIGSVKGPLWPLTLEPGAALVAPRWRPAQLALL